MPMYRFKCPECSSEVRILRRPEKAGDAVECPHCKVPMKRNAQGASSKVVEVLDNGIMSRRVERLANIEEINKERSKIKEDRGP